MTQTTKVAPRTVNRNFAYDDEAYHEVKRNLGRLIDAGQLRPAMQLALGLMKQGSYQVEMSDEGLMAQDIEDCLNVVLKALEKCDLPANEVIAWCSAMLDNERLRTKSLPCARRLSSPTSTRRWAAATCVSRSARRWTCCGARPCCCSRGGICSPRREHATTSPTTVVVIRTHAHTPPSRWRAAASAPEAAPSRL